MRDLVLLQNQHLSCGRKIVYEQVVEVHAACHLFTELVSAIPVDCFCFRFVYRCRFIPHIYASDNPPGCIVDGQGHKSVLCQSEGESRIGVEVGPIEFEFNGDFGITFSIWFVPKDCYTINARNCHRVSDVKDKTCVGSTGESERDDALIIKRDSIDSD